jgi:hypothetical protein
LFFFKVDWKVLLAYFTLINPYPQRPGRMCHPLFIPRTFGNSHTQRTRHTPAPSIPLTTPIQPHHHNDIEADAASVQSQHTITPHRFQLSQHVGDDAESVSSIRTIRPPPKVVTRNKVLYIPPQSITPPPTPPQIIRRSSSLFHQYNDIWTSPIPSPTFHRTPCSYDLQQYFHPHHSSSSSSVRTIPGTKTKPSSRFSMD